MHLIRIIYMRLNVWLGMSRKSYFQDGQVGLAAHIFTKILSLPTKCTAVRSGVILLGGVFLGRPPQKIGFFQKQPPLKGLGCPPPPAPPTLKIWLEKNEIFVWKNPFLGVFNLYFSQNFGRPPLPPTRDFGRPPTPRTLK